MARNISTDIHLEPLAGTPVQSEIRLLKRYLRLCFGVGSDSCRHFTDAVSGFFGLIRRHMHITQDTFESGNEAIDGLSHLADFIVVCSRQTAAEVSPMQMICHGRYILQAFLQPAIEKQLEQGDDDSSHYQWQQHDPQHLSHVSLYFLGITSLRLWGAYTQQSSWQAFNGGNSSPFRETIYELELILTMSTDNRYGFKLLNLGYVHQSNGSNTEFSRRWNRLYLQGGWEVDKLSALVRGWWRIPESADDNPDIEDYYGRAEVTLRWAPLDGSQLIGLTLRNNLNLDQNRSFIQLDWVTPVKLNQSGKLHIQFTSGYGETLIDYNFRQTTLGFGASFRDW